MNINLQFKIRSNKNYQRFLRENSHWYKLLNRDPANFKAFEEDMKDKYKLRPSDKVESFLEKINLAQSFFQILKN